MIKPKEITLDSALSSAFAKVAQHACRQGEKGTREWPPLSQLPDLESWKEIGIKYSREFAIELMTMYFSKGDFFEDLANLIARKSGI